MGLSPPVPCIGLALALTAVLAGCGGGTTAPPGAATNAASAPASQPAATGPARRAVGSATTTPAAPRATAISPPAVARTTTQRAAPATASAPKPASVPATPAPPAETAPKPVSVPIDEQAALTLTSRAGPAHYFQRGTITGTYAGTIATETRITSQGVLVSFTATVPGGTIVGHAIAVAILDSATWPGLRGSGEITGGTGRFAGAHGRGLTVSGRAKPDASQARVRLVGTVSY